MQLILTNHVALHIPQAQGLTNSSVSVIKRSLLNLVIRRSGENGARGIELDRIDWRCMTSEHFGPVNLELARLIIVVQMPQ